MLLPSSIPFPPDPACHTQTWGQDSKETSKHRVHSARERSGRKGYERPGVTARLGTAKDRAERGTGRRHGLWDQRLDPPLSGTANVNGHNRVGGPQRQKPEETAEQEEAASINDPGRGGAERANIHVPKMLCHQPLLTATATTTSHTEKVPTSRGPAVDSSAPWGLVPLQ